jgi:hypothetical protein
MNRLFLQGNDEWSRIPRQENAGDRRGGGTFRLLSLNGSSGCSVDFIGQVTVNKRHGIFGIKTL